jgi:hypothetical protein
MMDKRFSQSTKPSIDAVDSWFGRVPAFAHYAQALWANVMVRKPSYGIDGQPSVSASRQSERLACSRLPSCWWRWPD